MSKIDSITIWIENLINFWIAKEVDGVVAMFASNAECYDTPFSAQGDISTDWQEIRHQNILDISYNILMRQDDEFIVEFIIQYDDELCSAINHIKLNQDNRCIYLKQWYMSC